jgi:hypothetical protein
MHVSILAETAFRSNSLFSSLDYAMLHRLKKETEQRLANGCNELLCLVKQSFSAGFLLELLMQPKLLIPG